MTNLGSDNTPATLESVTLPSGFTVDEDGGDLVVRDTGGTVALRRVDGGAWSLESNALNNVGSLTTEKLIFGDADEILWGDDDDIRAKWDDDAVSLKFEGVASNNTLLELKPTINQVVLGERLNFGSNRAFNVVGWTQDPNTEDCIIRTGGSGDQVITFEDTANDVGTLQVKENSGDPTVEVLGNLVSEGGVNGQHNIVQDSTWREYRSTARRGDPTTSELPDGSVCTFVSDGTGTGSAGDLVYAVNDGGTIKTKVIVALADAT